MASAITDMEIEALAKDIGINQKLDVLGLNLGNEYGPIEAYKARNHSDAKVTHQGTKQMLQDWRDNISQEEQQRPILKKALEDAGLARLAEKHLGGEASTGTGQAGRSETETLSEQPRTQTKNGVTNTINAAGASNVSGNNMIGQQTNVYNSAPSAPAVHHHHVTTNVNRASPAMPVYIPLPAAPKRQANTILGPAPKRAKVTASILSTLKGTTSKQKKSATTQRKSKAKSPGNLPHANKKPAAPKASKKKAPKNKTDSKAPKKKAPKTAKKPKVTRKKPPKAKQPKTHKSKTSRQVRRKKR